MISQQVKDAILGSVSLAASLKNQYPENLSKFQAKCYEFEEQMIKEVDKVYEENNQKPEEELAPIMEKAMEAAGLEYVQKILNVAEEIGLTDEELVYTMASKGN
jgi:F0F1-type ATP synthase membrane subunit b/b'